MAAGTQALPVGEVPEQCGILAMRLNVVGNRGDRATLRAPEALRVRRIQTPEAAGIAPPAIVSALAARAPERVIGLLLGFRVDRTAASMNQCTTTGM